MDDFEAVEGVMFSLWFEKQRRADWDAKYPTEKFHENWGLGERRAMYMAWLARARTTPQQSETVAKPTRLPTIGDAPNTRCCPDCGCLLSIGCDPDCKRTNK
jgi:hypothetical protein